MNTVDYEDVQTWTDDNGNVEMAGHTVGHGTWTVTVDTDGTVYTDWSCAECGHSNDNADVAECDNDYCGCDCGYCNP